jgi:predicted alpha/beta superfamily hydrolase
MKNHSTLTVLMLCYVATFAQQNVRLEIASLPAYHASGSDIYLAGSFNSWNSQDEKYKFQKDGNTYFINLKLLPGNYEYKITRGGWDKVECKKGGAGIENRALKVEADTVIPIEIEEWQDRYPSKPRVNTASKNVHIIDTAFLMPQLKRTRKVWIYFPPGYNSSTTEKFPVLYMHDGQNVFDDATSFAGEWGVDEYLDTTSSRKCIVVAIDHGGSKRINEYCPYDMDRFGEGEGDKYLEFLVKTLKPFIDKNYRTLADMKYTFIAGSSMGGLISMYACLKYPDVFGGAGVFSPAFWVAPKIFDDIKGKGKKVRSKVYFYAGKLEGETMVPEMLKVFEQMNKVSRAKMISVVRDQGKHTESTWRNEFGLFYEWLLNK